MQRQRQYAVRIAVAHLAVRDCRPESVVAPAARADNELADAERISGAVGVLRPESLVVVLVSAEDDIRAVVGQRLPDRLHEGLVAVRRAGAEPRMVPVRQRAGGGVGGKIRAQPGLLRRSGAAAADGRAVAVERDDVPRADLVAVVPQRRVAGGRAEIAVVAARVRRHVVMVAGRGTRVGFARSPGRVIAVRELARGSGVVDGIAEQRDRAGQRGEDARRRLVAG